MNFPDFEKIRQEAQRRGDSTRMLADDGVKPEAGRVYTISPDFVCGDRSYIDCFVHVLSLSGPNALVRFCPEIHWRKAPKLLSVNDRAWFPAEDAYAIYLEHNDDA